MIALINIISSMVPGFFRSFFILLLAQGFLSCSPGKTDHDASGFAADSGSIAKGQVLFSQECSACHNFKQEAIGPGLGGVTATQSAAWLKEFIKNPQANRWNGKDAHAKALFEKYQTAMPSFPQLSDEDLKNLLAFIHTKKAAPPAAPESGPAPLKDPISKPVELSDLVVELKHFITIPPSSEQKPLARITQFIPMPGSNNVFVLDLRGKLYRITGGKSSVYMDLAKLRQQFIAQPGLATGFGSLAFHPEYRKNGLFYTSHTEQPRKAGDARRPDFNFADSIRSTVQYVITEWKSKEPNAAVFAGEGRELFRISMIAGIHGVQEIAFNPTARKGSDDYGALYIGIGDGGAVENGYAYLVHSNTKPWGTILRIDPAGTNSANGQYGIPRSNPFSDSKNAGVVREIYAYGFRNPHRMSWTHTGQMLVVNVGNSHIESVNLITPGADYGWPIREGTFEVHPDKNLSHVYPLPADDEKYHITYPVAQYDHSDGRAITGGFEYTGNDVPALKGEYLFGDILIGKLFYIHIADIRQGKQAPVYEWRVSVNGERKNLQDFTGPERVDLHFGRDNDGELYLMTKADGRVYRLK